MSETKKNYLPDVREQYEQLPYPERHPKDEKSRIIIPHGLRIEAVNDRCFKGQQNFENFRVLIAGGGTGDGGIAWAEQLREKKGSSVTYLDMSTSSMNIAKKRAEIRKLDNITWVNDSLLNLPDLDLEKFDFIDCTGVLHHLADPDAGLRALKSVLKPNGAMQIMVYAKYGRTGVYMIQELMRMVNNENNSKKEMIKNTHTILNNLPINHWVNISESCNLVGYKDKETDAGAYDLFLHSQDRAYSILEAHDWLERCDLKMANGIPFGEPFRQQEYKPETYIKDKRLLEQVKSYPQKIQQCISEIMAGKIGKHEFYVTHKDAGETEADINDKDNMVVCRGTGITRLINFEKAAAAAREHGGACTMTFDGIQTNPKLMVPAGKYVTSLLRHIDGEKTISEILETVRKSPKYEDKKIDEERLFNDFKNLFALLKAGYICFLRHKSIAPFKTMSEMQQRVYDMYIK